LTQGANVLDESLSAERCNQGFLRFQVVALVDSLEVRDISMVVPGRVVQMLADQFLEAG
jgi:hypothetical protein